MIKTEWDYSTISEAMRIVLTSELIAKGFYKINNYPVLPFDKTKKLKHGHIKFINLDYKKIPNYWARCTKNTLDNCVENSSDLQLVFEVENLLKQNKTPLYDFSPLQEQWEIVSKEILLELTNVIPNQIKGLHKVVITPGKFGSKCSFSIFNNKKTDFIRIYPGVNATVYDLVFAVVASCTRSDLDYKYNALWSEKQILADWLVGETKLSKIIQKNLPKVTHVPSMYYIRKKEQEKLLRQADKFYIELGLNIKSRTFSVDKNTILVDGVKLESLTAREFRILKVLINKYPESATFDDIAYCMNISSEKFSLYAISKQIQRLRETLDLNGISGSYICTERGVGYRLVSS